MIIWEIPFKNDNITIRFENDIQINKDKSNKLYFNIDDINDEFKNKLTIYKNIFNIFNIKKINNEKNIEDYIYFNNAKKMEIYQISLDINDKLIDIIKNDIIKKITFSKFLFKGKAFNEISIYVNDLNTNLLKIKSELTEIKNGNFTNINLDNKFSNYEQNYKDIIYHFDITENKPDNFSEILNIKVNFESNLHSIIEDFISLYNYLIDYFLQGIISLY